MNSPNNPARESAGAAHNVPAGAARNVPAGVARNVAACASQAVAGTLHPTAGPGVNDVHQLECRRLSVRRGRRLVLHEIELVIRDDECVTLIGPNGSGKTTLMLALLGLLPPAAGHVRIGGIDAHRLPPRARGCFAAYVPQVVERLPGFRVRDIVATGRYPHLGPLTPFSRADLDIVAQALEQCGLAALSERPINEVSGGERQKALIAAAVAQDARVMFLDEPNTALDPAYQVDLVRLLREWHARGRGLVLISHDLHLPAALGGRVIALCEGRVIADGAATDVLDPEKLESIYGTQFDMVTTRAGQRVALPRW